MTTAQIQAGKCDGEPTDELFVNGKFLVSYRPIGLTSDQEAKVSRMIVCAVEEGKRIRSQEFKALIG
jgi:hypothetical protein